MLTEEQIKYLQEIPNASELIRKILSQHMEQSKIITEEQEKARALQKEELALLWKQHWELKQELGKFWRDVASKYLLRWDPETKKNVFKPDTPTDINEKYEDYKRRLATLKERIDSMESKQ